MALQRRETTSDEEVELRVLGAGRQPAKIKSDRDAVALIREGRRRGKSFGANEGLETLRIHPTVTVRLYTRERRGIIEHVGHRSDYIFGVPKARLG